MNDAFDILPARADMSPCGRYRYTLERAWAVEPRYVLWLMLNPSTADATNNDATIRRCLGFAKHWGYTGILVGNLYALRATDPKALGRAMLADIDPIGPENELWQMRLVKRASLIVCAWGQSGPTTVASIRLMQHLRPPRVAHVLRMNGNLCPSHPLRLSKDLKPRVWNPFEAVSPGHGG